MSSPDRLENGVQKPIIVEIGYGGITIQRKTKLITTEFYTLFALKENKT